MIKPKKTAVKPRTSKRPAKGGRPKGGGIYKPSMAAKAAELAERGATDSELAAAFGIARNTLLNWVEKYPEFAEARARGKAAADDTVEKSLFNRATGQATHTEQRAVMVNGKPEIVTLHHRAPADVSAARLWLMNRRPKDWRERVDADIVAEPVQPVEIRIIAQSARKPTEAEGAEGVEILA